MDGIFGRLSWDGPHPPALHTNTREAARGAPWVQLGAGPRASLYQNETLSIAFEGLLEEQVSSAEQLAALYQKHGSHFLQNLRGTFALALWDEPQQQLLLARDRIGRRPLWWSSQGGLLSFSSSLSSIHTTVDEGAVRSYLRWGYMASPHSGKSGWLSLPAGCLLQIKRPAPYEPAPYWDLRVPPRVARCHDSSAATAQHARALLLHTTAQTPNATILLGSDILGGALVASQPGRFRISYVAVGEHAAREAARVKEFAALHKTQSTVAVYQAQGGPLPSPVELFCDTYSRLETPCADLALPARALAVALASHDAEQLVWGLGESFLFGIDEEYQPTAKVERLPRVARQVICQAARVLPKRFFHGERVTTLRQEARFTRLSLAQKLQERLSLFDTTLALNDDSQILSSYLQAPRGAKTNDRLFYAAFKRELPDEVIAPLEGLARSKNLSLVLPFCDLDVAEFAATMSRKIEPTSWLSKMFPEAPRPFAAPHGLPLAEWLRGPLRDLFSDTLGAPSAQVARFLDEKLILRILTEHQTTKLDHSRQLLALFSLELWLKKQRKGEAP